MSLERVKEVSAVILS